MQAQACGLEPVSDMNPVLLKPNSDTGAQVIIQGKVAADLDARAYHRYKPIARHAVLESFRRLSERYDAIVVEGAGSPAEINLRDNDIANMGFAEAVDCPVVLVADIDRGGVFAHLVGTLALLSDSERARVQRVSSSTASAAIWRCCNRESNGSSARPVSRCSACCPTCTVCISKPKTHCRGIRNRQRVPESLRVVAPAIHGSRDISASLHVIVPVLPRISNHTDFDALRLHPQVALRFVGPNEAIPAADLIILPGSKNVRADLAWLRTHGWDKAIARHLRYGGKLIGLCGGFQMLGTAIHDPHGLEGEAESSAGLGLLAFETTLEREKQLHRIRGVLALASAPVQGYEIHMGISHGPALERPALHLNGRTDGAISEDGQILGTYLHGLFDVPAACDALLAWAGLEAPQSPDHIARREAGIDRLADAVEQYLDTRMLEKLFGLTPSQSARRQAP